MDTKLVVLKLFLEELGIPTSIQTLDDRVRVQKAVYLGQLSGADLGYRFSWYLKGPYSPPLTKDYYGLAEGVEVGERDFEGKELKQPIRKKLQKIKPVLDVPQGLHLTPEDWLELISSYHYLRFVSKYDEKKTRDVIQKEKSRLFPFIENARDVLLKNGLLGETT